MVVIHGMVLGAIFLLSFAGGLAELINLPVVPKIDINETTQQEKCI